MSGRNNKYYPEMRFGGFSDVDGTINFYTRINSLIKPTDILLDIGCGRGAIFEDPIDIRRKLGIFKGKVKQVIGIDFDSAGSENPTLDAFYSLTVQDAWPLASNSIDLAFCDHVLEHVENPDHFFSECFRVLKENGILCMRTTNSWGYIAIGARLIPNRYHDRVLRKLQSLRQEVDVFFTVYKCNNVIKIRKMLRKYRFTGIVYGRDAEPAYFDNSNFLYVLALIYQKLTPAFLKSTLLVFARKNPVQD